MRHPSYPNLRESDWFWLQQIEQGILWRLHEVRERPWLHPWPGEYPRPRGMGSKFRRLVKLGLIEDGPTGHGAVLSKYGRRVLKLWREGT